MKVAPIIRLGMCATAHPAGCARQVEDQIRAIQARPRLRGPSRALVIGSSSGLGLASRITAAFGAGAGTIGVCFERPGTPTRVATAGWYRAAALDEACHAAGLPARTVVGDAHATEVKQRTIELVRDELGRVDLVVYSLASPRRVDPVTGEVYVSSLKTTGAPFTDRNVNFVTGEIGQGTMPVASEDEIRQTVAVMGGDDWALWIAALRDAGVLERGATTVAYSYVGGARLRPTYRGGTLGRAKDHLEATAHRLDAELQPLGGHARVAVMKALVTQSSAVLPISALYSIVLFRVMKEMGIHEGPIEQAYRLFADRLYGPGATPLDGDGRIRLDDLELRDDVQAEVARRLDAVTTDNLARLGDRDAFYREFLQIHGFAMPDIDYDLPVEPVRAIPASVIVEPSPRRMP